jgi:primase-polymerase (primpol)-like protein
MIDRDAVRAHEAKFYTAYAEELREHFRSGFLAEFASLRQPQFVVWQHRPLSDGRLYKQPYDPKTMKFADPANPESWGRLDQALKALKSGYYNGLGVVFAKKDTRYPAKKADPFAGITLNGCVGNNRSINRQEQGIIDFLQTHTHYADQNSIHLLMEVGEDGLPGPGRKAGNTVFSDRNAFLPVTPHLVPGTPAAIEPRRIEAGYVYFSLIPPELWPAGSEH